MSTHNELIKSSFNKYRVIWLLSLLGIVNLGFSIWSKLVENHILGSTVGIQIIIDQLLSSFLTVVFIVVMVLLAITIHKTNGQLYRYIAILFAISILSTIIHFFNSVVFISNFLTTLVDHEELTALYYQIFWTILYFIPLLAIVILLAHVFLKFYSEYSTTILRIITWSFAVLFIVFDIALITTLYQSLPEFGFSSSTTMTIGRRLKNHTTITTVWSLLFKSLQALLWGLLSYNLYQSVKESE